MSVVGKSGYKETDVGWIPMGWEAARLQEVTTESKRRNHGMLDDSTLSGVLKGQGLVPMRERVKGAETTRCLVVEPNAFAYNPMRINIGSIAKNDRSHAVMVSPDYVVFGVKPSRLLPEYLDHFRYSWLWGNFVGDAGNGSVRVRIYYDQLSTLELPLPPLPEQRKIAAILTAVDDKLDVIERQIEATQTLKRGLMQTLFSRGVGTQDAEGRWVPHDEFKDSELGEIPVGWELRTLDEVSSVERGKFSARPRNDPKYFIGGNIPFIQTGDVALAPRFISTGSQLLNSSGLGVSKLFPSGTIFITIAANIGDVAISTKPLACPDSVVGIITKTSVADRDWLYYLLENSKAYFDSRATQNAQKI